MEVPMLDEDEYAIIEQLYTTCTLAAKEFREATRSRLEETPIDDFFRPVREAYAKLTGWENTHQEVIRHHRISIYGEPCRQCSKPLRTPEARFCASCGALVKHDNILGE